VESTGRAQELLRTVVRGYRNVFRGLGTFLAGAAVLVAVGVIVVYPLWLFAARSPEAFTAIVLAAVAIGIVAAIARWFVREARQASDGLITPLRKAGSVLLRVLAVALFLVGVYIAALLLQVNRIGLAAALGFLLLAVLGLLFSGAGDRRSGHAG
jgi:hypothetical protein